MNIDSDFADLAPTLIARALVEAPGLTITGLEATGPSLLSDPRAPRVVAACAQYLSRCAWLPQVDKRRTTGHLKGQVERFFGLTVASGHFLAAAIGLGITWERAGEGSPFAWLAVTPAAAMKEMPTLADAERARLFMEAAGRSVTCSALATEMREQLRAAGIDVTLRAARLVAVAALQNKEAAA